MYKIFLNLNKFIHYNREDESLKELAECGLIMLILIIICTAFLNPSL